MWSVAPAAGLEPPAVIVLANLVVALVQAPAVLAFVVVLVLDLLGISSDTFSVISPSVSTAIDSVPLSISMPGSLGTAGTTSRHEIR